jgi:hypothetical protein
MFAKKQVDPRLANIEHAGRLDPGLAALLQKSLVNYDDSLLRGELGGAAEEVARAGLSQGVFEEVALSASAGYVTRGEAGVMFRVASDRNAYAVAVAAHLRDRAAASADAASADAASADAASADTDDAAADDISPRPPPPSMDRQLCDALFRALLKKLLVLHLTRDVCSHRLLVAGSSKSLDFYRTRSISEPKKNGSSSKKRSARLGATQNPLRSATPVSALYRQLADSNKTQQKLDKQIAGNLTLLSQTISLGDRTSAVAFSKQVGTRKVEVLLHKKLSKYYSLFFGKWKNTYKSMNAEIFSIKFLKLFGATKIWEYTAKQMFLKKLRYIKKWYTVSLSMQQGDVAASVETIQRVVRGWLGRIRVRNIRQTRAATAIQKKHRGHLGRMRMQDRRRHLQLVAAVAVVERAYQKHIWIRAGNMMRVMLHRDKACRKIQRAAKIHKAVVIVRTKRRARLMKTSVTKIQGQWRKYLATVRVDDVRRKRMTLDSAKLLQRVVRGLLGRIYARDTREVKLAVSVMQGAWRCSLARARVQVRRRIYRATKIQSAIRARWGRKRFRILYNARHDALAQIARGVRGYRDRRRVKPLLAAYTAKRSIASGVLARQIAAVKAGQLARRRVKHMLSCLLMIQMMVRRFLFYRRASLRERSRRNVAAKIIQRLARGYNGRRLVVVLRAQKEIDDVRKGRNKVPLYYRVYEQYLRDQFMLHRPMVLRLQCFFRVRKAVRKTTKLRHTRAVKKIQYVFRRHMQTKDAREVLRQKRLLRIYRNECATHVNKVIRGFLGRCYVKKIHSTHAIKWFILQLRSKGLASRVFDQFRMRKRKMERAIRAASFIQGLVRGRAGRNYMRYNEKRLVKERRLRVLRLRNKAARNMQALYHIMLAKNIAAVKRQERDARLEQQRVLDDLDERIDGIHGEHMIGLMTTRLQTGARAKIARRTKKERAADRLREAELKEEKLRYAGATKMQALARGMKAREKFMKEVAQLRKEKQSRNFCVECESQVATKRCRQCKDRFCDSCYDTLHRTGKP